ncbi:MAG: cupin domain-containing protein [Gammaproteobacteria bacterium]
MSLLGKLTARQFLRGHWQKKPLLIRQALPGFVCPLSPEELAGLACEDGVESRLVTTAQGQACPWQLRHGPFTDTDFTSLPDQDWTLLVQDCQRYDEQVAALLQHFDFIPQWRLDDIMISYATPGGSVGPHIDQYDVFLIQGSGERRWQIDYQAQADDNLMGDCDMDILREFNADETWVLYPGDMLYLPPRLAHYGVALNDCMTLSVGFRAPSHQEMLAAYLETLLQQQHEQQRFTDPHRGLPEHPAEIEAEDIEQFAELLQQQLSDRKMLADVFGRLVTEAKHVEAFTPSHRDRGDILLHGITLDPDVRLAFSREHYYHNRLFANGVSLEVSPPAARLVPQLCADGRLDADAYADIVDTDEFGQLVDFLMEHGLLAHEAVDATNPE